MFRTTVLIVVGTVVLGLLHARPIDAKPLQDSNRGAKESEAGEEEKSDEAVTATVKEEEEAEEEEDHNINKRGNINAEENANQLFRNAFKVHNLNVDTESTNSEAGGDEEGRHGLNDEQEKADGAMPVAEQNNNNYSEDKSINEIEKASEDREAGGDLANEQSPSKFKEDKAHTFGTEGHHNKRCGNSGKCTPKEPDIPARDDKPIIPCDYEESEKFKQNSTKIAQQAAKAAKLASDSQKMAAEHAARIVKTQLSEQAQQASQKAQAVLAGKESLVAEIECQLHEAEELYKEMRNSLEHIRMNLENAGASRQDACDEIEALQIAVKIGKKNIADAEAVVEGTQEVVESREALLHSAKRRLQTLLNQLKAARCDYRNTKVLAGKAALAAAQAKANVSRCRRKLILANS